MKNGNLNFTSVSTLVEAKTNGSFTLNWSYTNDIAQNFKIFRYIGTYPPNVINDPTLEANGENYVLIGSTGSGISGTYIDSLNDLNLNGFTYNTLNSKWYDGQYDVLDQIFETKRSIYYKVIAESLASGGIAFNTLPFVFITYNTFPTATIVCKSTITQVKYDKLAFEGENFWNRSDIITSSTVECIAVDPIIGSGTAKRNGLLWVAGNNGAAGQVVVVDTATGGNNFKQTYNFSYPIYGLKIDPSTGDAIVGGKKEYLARCVLASNTVQDIPGSTPLTLGTGSGQGNYALALTQEGNNFKVYSIWNKNYVLKYDITSPGPPTKLSELDYVVNANSYGYRTDQNNLHGIITTPSGTPLVNGYEMFNVSYTGTACNTVIGTCVDRYWDPDNQRYTTSVEYPCPQTECYTYSINSGPFLGDRGYIYNPLNAVNNQFTSCNNRSGFPCTPEGNQAWYATYSHDGMVVDFTNFGVGPYHLWQSNSVENLVHSFNATSNTITDDVNYNTTKTNALGVDSENNIWAISNNNSHSKIYQLNAGSTFPTEGSCTWPVSGTSDWTYGSFYNDAYVEYVLTRNATDTLYAQITATTNDSIKRQLARQWTILNGGNVPGKRVYPNYSAFGSQYIIPRDYVNITTQPNSDETGADLYLYSTTPIIYSLPTYKRPDYTLPQVELILTPIQSSPKLSDSNFWNDQKTSALYNITGYDDLTVQMQVSVTNTHSFDITGWNFTYDDKSDDIGCNSSYPSCGTNPTESGVILSDVTLYKYHDPSQSGKPFNRYNGFPGEINGTYSPHSTAWSFVNCYLISGATGDYGETYWDEPVRAITPERDVCVWERWPTAQFYIIPCDMKTLRQTWYGTTIWNIKDKFTVGANTSNVRSPNRIVSGYDPLSAQFVDLSIARTWPVSAWYINFGRDNHLYPVVDSAFVNYGYTANYPPISQDRGNNGITYTSMGATITTDDSTYAPRDAETQHGPIFAETIYFNPGTYCATLYVQASCTGTESAMISNGITDQNIISTFSKYTTACVIVLEACPWPNFRAISGCTVPSDYHDEYGTVIADPICAVYINNDGTFISGYAPNLTMTWQDSSVARSYPISSYTWNFDDYYDEVNNEQTIIATQVINGYPGWITDKTNHYATHRFTIPGVYTVSLNASVSTTSTTACELCAKYAHVYVEELPQSCDFSISLSSDIGFGYTILSGESPLTLYFNPSGIIPGSFPICRIDWDFGDGSDILTITRKPSTETFIGPIAYPLDISDPRNVIVSHNYIKQTITSQDTFVARISSYTCNTNNMVACSGNFGSGPYNIGPIISTPETDDDIINKLGIDKPKHLINNRLYNNDNKLYMTFEGIKSTLNYVLSTGDN